MGIKTGSGLELRNKKEAISNIGISSRKKTPPAVRPMSRLTTSTAAIMMIL